MKIIRKLNKNQKKQKMTFSVYNNSVSKLIKRDDFKDIVVSMESCCCAMSIVEEENDSKTNKRWILLYF